MWVEVRNDSGDVLLRRYLPDEEADIRVVQATMEETLPLYESEEEYMNIQAQLEVHNHGNCQSGN